MRTRRRVVWAAAVGVALLVVGCGSESPSGNTTVPADVADADPGDPTARSDSTRPTDADPSGSRGASATTEPPPLHPRVDALPAGSVVIDGEREHVVAVRVARRDHERRAGLQHVESLPDGTGMLFVFPEPHRGAFWMKDTLVPLDIAFANDEGTIEAILTMLPCEADPCPSYDPQVTYRTALEVPAGWFADNGVEVGDGLRLDGAPAP